MQTDKDLFDLIKESFPLDPREDFVSETSKKLRQIARKQKRKRRMIQFSFASTSFIICALAISWFFFYGGKDTISNNLYSLGEVNSPSSINSQDPLVYIYQTHNKESFATESKTNEPSEAFHENKNISLVGERLSESLKKKNINSIHDKTNIMGILKERGLSFTKSYEVSRNVINTALEKNKSIKMVFDIHRGAEKRSDTTINLNGKDYPTVAFIVSRSSSNFEENFKNAELLHNKLELKYPGLSKGVIVKNNPNQNTYNQDLLDNSVLLEIGGFENTLEEEYRTADILAEIISDILRTNK